jgi:hypothetical protein
MPGGERGSSEKAASLAMVAAGLFYIGDDPDRRRDGHMMIVGDRGPGVPVLH